MRNDDCSNFGVYPAKMEKFIINIPAPAIEDMKLRLGQTRWPFEIPGSGWRYGTDLTYLKALCDYWKDTYDWRRQEEALNKFHHHKTRVEGFGLHYIYEKGKGKKNLPLLLIHGWPDSFYRFIKLIPLLTKPDANGIAFDVIVPSIPGFGFSDRPNRPGMDRVKIAALFHSLMTGALGYPKFFVQGGDWGGSIAQQLGLDFNDSIKAIHLSSIPSPIIFSTDPALFNNEELKYYQENKKWQQTEGTFTLLQSTKPQTLAYELNDSPSGLAGWYIEKFRNWSDSNGNPEERFTKDELLTNLCIYWFTQTAGSAERLYYEGIRQAPIKPGQMVMVPTYISVFPKDLLQMPESFARRFFNVQRWHKMDAGGHFAAWEVPQLLAGEIRQSFGSIG